MSLDRNVAGDTLAQTIKRSGDREGAVVAGIPRGGAIVGARVALGLGLAYECVPVCRIGMPCFPDLTLGAIDPDGIATFEPQTQLTRYELTKTYGALSDHLKDQVTHCRGDREPLDLTGRDVIVVDEAADTAVVAQSAAEYLRRQGAARLVFATPVASEGVLPRLRELYDEVIVDTKVPQVSVGSFYSDGVPGDDAIRECLTRAWEASPERP